MPVTEICSGTRLERILLATDFSAVAEVATAYAVGLARHFSSMLEAAHVIDLSSADPTLDVLMEPALEALRHSGRERLQHLAEGISGLTLKKKMIEGHRAAAVLVGEAIDASADLIVLGTSSKHGLTKLTLGSTAEEVIREAPCPVLTIGPHVSEACQWSPEFPEDRLRNRLLSTVRQSCDPGAPFAKDSEAKVYLCHVVGDGRTAEEEPPDAASLGSFKALMNGSAKGHCPIECVVERGEVAGAVLGLATWVDADLIVMGAEKRRSGGPTSREGSPLPFSLRLGVQF